MPEGRKKYNKTAQIQFEEFADCIAWWSKRKENERAWKVPAEKIAANGYNLDIKNPNAKADFEHLPPEQLAADIRTKQVRLAEIMKSIESMPFKRRPTTDWPSVKLGEVLAHRKEFIQIDDFASYKRCRVQLHAQGVVLRDQVSGIEIKTKKQQICRAGEFLVAEIDAKVGGYGLVPSELEGAIVSSHYFLFVINEMKLDRRFLDFYIRTPMFHDQVAAQGSTNYAAIRPNHVLTYTIPLPSLSVQIETVKKMEYLAHALEIHADVAAELRALNKVLLDRVFRGEM